MNWIPARRLSENPIKSKPYLSSKQTNPNPSSNFIFWYKFYSVNPNQTNPHKNGGCKCPINNSPFCFFGLKQWQILFAHLSFSLNTTIASSTDEYTAIICVWIYEWWVERLIDEWWAPKDCSKKKRSLGKWKDEWRQGSYKDWAKSRVSVVQTRNRKGIGFWLLLSIAWSRRWNMGLLCAILFSFFFLSFFLSFFLFFFLIYVGL